MWVGTIVFSANLQKYNYRNTYSILRNNIVRFDNHNLGLSMLFVIILLILSLGKRINHVNCTYIIFENQIILILDNIKIR